VRARPFPHLVVMGGSAGGLEAVASVLGSLPDTFDAPILVAIHVAPDPRLDLSRFFGHSPRAVHEAEPGTPLAPRAVAIAPPDYHLLVEADGRVALSADPPVCYSRPSIDVLFESAATSFGAHTTAVLLSGANRDGSEGLLRVRERGGRTVVQSPETAASPEMPRAALERGAAAHVLPLEEIGPFLAEALS